MQEREYIKGLKSFSNFRMDINSSRLFHSIMLINKDEDFLTDYAIGLAGEILSHGQEERERILNKVEKEIHPDLLVYGKEKPIDANIAKEIVADVYVAPYEGERKVYVIHKFDEIQSSPANKLLKTLEEPPAGVTFILLVKNEAKVLQTILSRAQKFYLEGYTIEKVSSILKERGIKDSDVIGLESGGILTDAVKLAENKNSAKIANFVLETLEDFKVTTQLARYSLMAEDFKDVLPELLSFFSSIASLAIHKKAGKSSTCTQSIDVAVGRIARMWSYTGLIYVIEASLNALKMLDGFVNVNNVLDQFFLKILEIRRKCRI